MASRHESRSPDDRGPSRHQGSEHHGWSPDVDEKRQQDNPSAHRSFHPEEHAPSRGAGREPSKEERTSVPGDAVKSETRRGEEHGAGPPQGRRDTERRGTSGRPAGGKDASEFTGVDPDDS
ncbi:hypothetical protein HCJ93_09740 [Streptomyces sp. SBST2-5]|uniref:Uncharacterized protein n=1 Tax=Streptomyces composti TaxID=2720025 RepID=A0ABX1A1S2_9ACTN|nr:hypothetical protein [Streptomyces composti]NJP50345.1 hypothetical protein [Streptomyces composti]